MTDRSQLLVTVFGGGGFVGRYVCEFLLNAGVRVRVAQRNPRQAHAIQPLAQVGQLGFARANIENEAQTRAAVDGANAVINLCGVFGKSMEDVHVTGARHVAEAARAAGSKALVHISAIGADAQSPSRYGRTKAQGEEAVRNAFPDATIIRPSLVFGPEDELTNRFAGMARLPVLPILAGDRKFQPIYVRDLAKAIAMSALDPKAFGGKTFEVGGPQVMSMVELHREVLAITGQNPELLELPDAAGKFLSWFGWVPGAPLSADQWKMLQKDNVPGGKYPGIDAFGIEPSPLGAVGVEWLGRYDSAGRFSRSRVNLTATN